MRADEARAAGDLAGGTLGGGGGLVEELHEAVAGRVFGALGPMGAPVKVVHDGVSRGVHAAVRRALTHGPKAASAALAATRPADAPRFADTKAGGYALAIVNGWLGDDLVDEGSPLALELTVRLAGRDVVVTPDGLAGAYPDATGKVAVFVHGLLETEDAWRLAQLRRDREDRRTHGDRLRDDLGFTPVYVRYNTGRHISDNGHDLAEVLERLVRDWPVEVTDLVLVGHSMGGLVARSAVHQAECDEHRTWTDVVSHVCSLGSPHLGAPIEKGFNVLGWGLRHLPETRPLARVFDDRSVGIKDLRYGAVTREDWDGHDPDELLKDRCGDVPFLESATYTFIGATVAEGPVGHLVGDLLVRLPSASGKGKVRKLPFAIDAGAELHGLTHFDLLDHELVYVQLKRWLTQGEDAPVVEDGERVA